MPCGVADTRYGVTSLVDLGHTVSMPEVDMALRREFENLFGTTQHVPAAPVACVTLQRFLQVIAFGWHAPSVRGRAQGLVLGPHPETHALDAAADNDMAGHSRHHAAWLLYRQARPCNLTRLPSRPIPFNDISRI